MEIKLNVNGKDYKIDVDPSTTLLDALRMLGFKSVKRGCDTGSCGVCTVWLDKKPALSCSILAAQAEGHEITTIEGLVEDEDYKKFTEYLLEEGADQCGFCSPGLIMTVLAIKRDVDEFTDEKVRRYLIGNLCRCTGYMGQMRAVWKFLEVNK